MNFKTLGIRNIKVGDKIVRQHVLDVDGELLYKDMPDDFNAENEIVIAVSAPDKVIETAVMSHLISLFQEVGATVEHATGYGDPYDISLESFRVIIEAVPVDDTTVAPEVSPLIRDFIHTTNQHAPHNLNNENSRPRLRDEHQQ